MKTKSQLPYILSTNLMIIIVALLLGSVYYNLSYQAINHYVNKLVQKDIAYPNDNDNKFDQTYTCDCIDSFTGDNCDVAPLASTNGNGNSNAVGGGVAGWRAD